MELKRGGEEEDSPAASPVKVKEAKRTRERTEDATRRWKEEAAAVRGKILRSANAPPKSRSTAGRLA